MAKTQMYRNDVLAGKQINLYPVTEAKYVTMNDGQSVEEMMSSVDANKYTPTIENSSSMFKVGQGDSVDLSSSVKEGAYNSCVLKGVTKYIDNDTNEILDQFEEGRNLSLIDCKSPILSNVGKNLFNGNWDNTPPSAIYTTDFIRVEPLSQYVINIVGQLRGSSVQFFDENKKAIQQKDTTTVLTTQETRYIKWTVRLIGDISPIGLDVQIEKSSTITTYELYKSNILSIPTYYDEESDSDKTIVLRSLPNGVCDTLNVETGEYVQRVGEHIFSGNDDELVIQYADDQNRNTLIAILNKLDMKVVNEYVTNDLNVDKIPSQSHVIWNQNVEGIHNKRQNIYINILKSHLNSNDSVGVNAWLQANPITVQYELATPIVRKVDISGFPYAYANGHVILSSGSIEQSLTPKVEYSLVANKAGQIDTNTKMALRHDKQINDFESVMLVSLLESSYQKTLMKFNFDMQMTSLGGEE